MTVVYGRFDPSRDHVAPPSEDRTTPRSVPRMILPPPRMISFAGMSGRLPLTSVQCAQSAPVLKPILIGLIGSVLFILVMLIVGLSGL